MPTRARRCPATAGCPPATPFASRWPPSVRAAAVEPLARPPAAADVPEPRRRPGEALVRIHAAALNPVERHIWNGHFFDGPPRPPYVIGLEGIGLVEEGD